MFTLKRIEIGVSDFQLTFEKNVYPIGILFWDLIIFFLATWLKYSFFFFYEKKVGGDDQSGFPTWA